MSKLSFRARALDPSKPLNIHIAEELPDLTEYSAINRAVPQMPSGMEKEEESEHHLQRAICTGLIIPTPEVFDIDQEFYDRIYPEDFKISRQLIRMQPLGIEQDIPDYDMDSADEAWIDSQNRRFDLSPLKFEEMMDRLEKSSGQTVVTLNEAKALLKQDDEISIAVYDYWLNKRLTTQHPLILTIKTENRAGSAVNNPYIAFRRRTEKMQTRKNRKNDETSYEKMLKLKRNLSRAVTLLEMIKRREKTKREHVHLGIEIFEKRYQAKDFNGCLLNEFTNNAVKTSRSAFAPLYGNQYAGQQSNQYWSNSGYATGANSSLLNKHGNNDVDGVLHNNNRKEKRQYKKRKHKNQREKQPSGSTIDHLASSDEDEPIINLNHLGHDAENEGLYPFRRSSSSQYQRPTQEYGYWPWETKNEKSAKYRFTLTSIRHPRVRCIGFSRRRRGRGGRIVLDRISTNMDEFWANLDYTIYSGNQKITAKELTQQNELKNQQQLMDIVQDKPTSVVIDLEPPPPPPQPQPSIPSSSNKPVSLMQLNSGNSESLKNVSSRDGTENIVINIDEKTKVTVGENLDKVNRTKNDIANKTIESRMKHDSNVNKDNNNNSGNSNNSSIVMYKGNNSGLSSNSLRNHISDSANDLSAALQQNHDAFSDDKYVTNQLYSELFGDWLHFRPKTPDEDIDMFNFGEDFPQFAENASLAVDIQRLTENNLPNDQCNDVGASTSSAIGYGKSSPTKQLIDQTVDHTFTTNPFTYEYVTTTTPKIESYSSDSSSSPKSDDESSVDDIAGISQDLSLGDNEANDKAIDTLLEECKFDDLKSNAFWNGLLDENGSLLDVIDNKKPLNKNKDEIDDVSDLGLSSVLSSAVNIDRKPIRRRSHQPQKIGHSMFNVANLHGNESTFSKSNANETASKSGAIGNSDENRTNSQDHQCLNRTKNDGSVTIIDSTVKKELIDGDANEIVSNSSNIMQTGGIQIKNEPMDESIASNADEQSLHTRQQIVPVIKTEIGNNVPIVSNTALQRPITIQQGAHIQHQSHQQAFSTNDQTLIFSSRPIRRLTTNGPAENKAVQHLVINRKIQMVQQRSVGDDEKDVKPKILEGTYLKLPTDFNVVSSNALTTINASSATSKHNYSLPPQAAFHQPITLIGQSQQSQNKVIINPNGQVDFHEISELPRNFHDVHRESKNVKITIPTSNIKLNIVPSLAQVMQSGSVLIDAKSGTVRNDMNQTSQQQQQQQQQHQHQQQQQQQQQGIEQNVSVATASTSSPNVTQIHYQQPMQQQQSQQQKVSPHSRILYTNLKNNRGGTQFLAQLNPSKVVNILPIQHKGNANASTVQGIVNKALRSVVVSSSQSQNQQLATAFQRQSANANSAQANALMGTNAGSGTLFITTSSASDPSSIINCSINTNVNQNSVLVGNSSLAPVTDATLLNLNHNDGNATTINR